MASKPRKSGRITGTLYRPLVRALFQDTQTMVLGVIASTAGVLLTAYHTNSPYLLALAAIMALTGVARYFINIGYKRAQIAEHSSTEENRVWERRYSIGAIATAACLGGWSFVSMAVVGDDFAALVAIAISFANLIGIAGRNFPIERLFNAQVALVGFGLVAGGLAMGDIHALVSILMIPFILSLRNIASSQRFTLFSALTERKKAERLASQFDTALNNVPQAIIMFDANRLVEVSNAHVEPAMGLAREHLNRRSCAEIMKILVTKDLLDEDNAETIEALIANPNTHRNGFEFKFGPERKRTVKMAVNPMENGGVVTTFDDITKEIEAANTIDHMARFDRLTGLVNRDQLQIILKSELDYRSPEQQCAAILVNLDKFKQINDTLGHHKGDLVLKAVTKKLETLVGDVGICARYAGDEFAVILRSRDCVDVAQNFADEIIETLNQPIKIENGMVRIASTIGLAFASRAGDTAELLLKQADMALHFAKTEGRGEWRVFDIALSQELEQRRKLEEELRVALANKEFETYYQPLVSTKQRQVTTCEALLRWNSPKSGFVSPAIFIPIAEELGLIEDIGTWVLHEACRDCATWPNDTRVAVNLSAVQFRQGDILETVKSALSESGLDPRRLELEITESLMLSDLDETVARLNEFKEMGVRISLDDFGTGYSSLSYMNDLPLDKVKIDRSFVEELSEGSKTMTLVQGISALGDRLGLSVVVEGIEESEQLNLLLRNARVTEIQGYYFSKPVSAPEIAELLDRTTLQNRRMVQKMPKLKQLAA